MLPTMQELMEDAMYIYQGGLPMYLRDAAYHWICV